MTVVHLKLDESVVSVCLAHEGCSQIGGPPADECDRRWIYGVGGAVYESIDGLASLQDRLHGVRQTILARTGIEDAPRMLGFIAHGWHATKDGPEFADPLLTELDRGASFKGHVRYVVSSVELSGPTKERVFDLLFVALLRVVMLRYRDFERIDIVFEADQSPRSRYAAILEQARPMVTVDVRVEPKGDSALAMADYLLYATLKYLARVMERCQSETCDVGHRPPTANEVSYSAAGAVELYGHLNGRDYALRMYKAFVRSMSSIIELPGVLGQVGGHE
ncbi:hypothetical protein FBY40_2667 [Microbacterium sp. SLBN-154]|uniref:hypothetical protein n=1 Tax=Microbacterium sp. SLBN-154 TaxID=2768458 RepID=UPI0011507DDD|nr:hypothetical protein [Microbacterium sp. SLBN-154]TQK20144.1 hypothetical protein FBY40_2667 [Microbacterium sp. SLBN-154]